MRFVVALLGNDTVPDIDSVSDIRAMDLPGIDVFDNFGEGHPDNNHHLVEMELHRTLGQDDGVTF